VTDEELTAWVRSRPPLDSAAVESASADMLVDEWVPGAPLLISFAFVNWERPADFYLFGRSRKLETLCGRRFNRILLRDPRNLWYLRGIPELGGSVAETVAALRRLIQTIGPSEVWCVGESMGGYAALLYGILLGASRIVSFGPLSTFSATFASEYEDLRWRDVMLRVDPAELPVTTDLPELARRTGHANPIHLIAGTSAGPGAPEAVNLDVMHAERFSGLPGVRFHYYPEAEHAVTKWLADAGRFDGILSHCLQDAPLAETVVPAPLHQEERAEPIPRGGADSAPLLIGFAAETGEDDLFNDAFVEQLRDAAITLLLVRGETPIEEIRRWIAPLAPSRIVCLGSGLAGYDALLTGARLGADRILALNPLSIRDRRLAHLWHDHRFEVADGPDLLPILARHGGEIHVACSVRGIGEGDDVGSHDAVHAQRLGTLPNVHVQSWPASGSLAGWMRERKLLTGFLAYCGFGP